MKNRELKNHLYRSFVIPVFLILIVATLLTTVIVCSYLFGDAVIYRRVIGACDCLVRDREDASMISNAPVSFEKIRKKAINGDSFSIVLLCETYKHGYFQIKADYQMMKRTRTLLGVEQGGAEEYYLSEMIDECEKVYLLNREYQDSKCENCEPLILWSGLQNQIMDVAIFVHDHDTYVVLLLIGLLIAEFMVLCVLPCFMIG